VALCNIAPFLYSTWSSIACCGAALQSGGASCCGITHCIAHHSTAMALVAALCIVLLSMSCRGIGSHSGSGIFALQAKRLGKLTLALICAALMVAWL